MALILAPLAGYTDKAFRQMATEYGADETVTEMVSAEGLARDSDRTIALMERFSDSENLTLQLFGSNVDAFRRAIRNIRDKGFKKIDINAGCPVPKVVKTGSGSALMRNAQTAGAIIRMLKEETGLKVSIKFRLGWDDESINYLEFAQAAAESGADELTLHARTRSQGYSGDARKEHFRALRSLFPKTDPASPLLYASGDVFTPEDALSYLVEYEMDGVMFARGAIGNPFIFAETKDLIEKGSYCLPSLKERKDALIKHLMLSAGYYSESVAVREMRKTAPSYVKGLKNSSRVKDALCRAGSIDEYISALKALEA